jgi:phenylpyruvate tautomerase PptA (4-oxalocrotonate tautomerase family)
MPMLDAYIPEGPLSPSAERELVAKLTDLLLEHEGVDPTNEFARNLAWVFVHRPQVYVAGAPPKAPRYRFICQVREGEYNDERRAAVTAEMTQAVAKAEGGAWPHPELRVCIFTCEVPDGWWGGAGRILRLADIYELAGPNKPGMNGQPREAAARVLAAHRRQHAEELLAAVGR